MFFTGVFKLNAFLSVKMSDDSTKNKQVFEGDKYAEDYRKGRPKHPESLINAVLHFLRLKVQKHAPFFKSQFPLNSYVLDKQGSFHKLRLYFLTFSDHVHTYLLLFALLLK